MMNYAENYLKDYGDDFVSEKSLKYLLPLLYPDAIKEVSVKKICSFYDNIKLFSEDMKNKRFDFISVSKRLIIEFDGRQHFEHVKHFGSFEQFVERQSIDLDKQRFIKENNFHLIRITGKLTLREFYDLIKDKKFDDDHGQVIFIEDTTIYETNIDQLKEMSDESLVLKLKVKNLEDQVKLLNKQLHNNESSNIKSNNIKSDKCLKASKDLVMDSDQVYQYMTWLKDQGFLIDTILTYINYQQYLYWNKTENDNIKPLKKRELTERMKKLAPKFGLIYIDKNLRLSAITDLDYNVELLNEQYFNGELKYNKYETSRYFLCSDQISVEDIESFKSKLENNELDDVQNYRELVLLEHLISKKFDPAIVFKQLLKDKYDEV